MNVTKGLPEGWSFETIEHDHQVTYEVRNEHRFLIMSSTWDRTDSPTADQAALGEPA